jgi:hypothetical protein
MGSARASLSKTALDRTVATEVETAARAIQRALAACKVARKGDAPPSRLARVIRDLGRAQGALGHIGRTSAGWDAEDPDLMSEDRRAEQWRLDRARLEKEEADRAAAAAEAEALDQEAD